MKRKKGRESASEREISKAKQTQSKRQLDGETADERGRDAETAFSQYDFLLGYFWIEASDQLILCSYSICWKFDNLCARKKGKLQVENVIYTITGDQSSPENHS